jgi:radical SAM enzyme (TIGR01210 family)
VVPVSTLFLTNRECPWRCVMCDLWKNTLTDTVPLGAIPEQIEFALRQLPPARHIKLYNSGSFFDVQAIPPEDYSAIAALLKPFERVIVESHPALVGSRCAHFRDLLSGQLEVAMGLETVHPEALQRLNKRVTLEQFAAAAERLREQAIELRVFVLMQPPFVRRDEALYWAQRSLDFAFDCNATAVTLIPTRAGNGAMDIMQQAGEFTPPELRTFEKAVEYGAALGRGRVFADLWEIERIATCAHCRVARIARLEYLNLTQSIPPILACERCEGDA